MPDSEEAQRDGDPKKGREAKKKKKKGTAVPWGGTLPGMVCAHPLARGGCSEMPRFGG
jgi:hypothetical protein